MYETLLILPQPEEGKIDPTSPNPYDYGFGELPAMVAMDNLVAAGYSEFTQVQEEESDAGFEVPIPVSRAIDLLESTLPVDQVDFTQYEVAKIYDDLLITIGFAMQDPSVRELYAPEVCRVLGGTYMLTDQQIERSTQLLNLLMDYGNSNEVAMTTAIGLSCSTLHFKNQSDSMFYVHEKLSRNIRRSSELIANLASAYNNYPTADAFKNLLNSYTGFMDFNPFLGQAAIANLVNTRIPEGINVYEWEDMHYLVVAAYGSGATEEEITGIAEWLEFYGYCFDDIYQILLEEELIVEQEEDDDGLEYVDDDEYF